MDTFWLIVSVPVLLIVTWIVIRRSPLWPRIVAFFADSETIFYARLQMAIGVVAAIITYVDPELVAPIFPHGWAPWVILVNGIATEWLRRRRDPEMGK